MPTAHFMATGVSTSCLHHMDNHRTQNQISKHLGIFCFKNKSKYNDN